MMRREKLRRLKMTVPARVRKYLKELLKQGLSGNTERQVALRLIEDGLRKEFR